MSNRFTLEQAIDRSASGKVVLDGYEVDHVLSFHEDGRPMYTFDMEELDQPNRTFDGTMVIELVNGEADIVDVDGDTARVEFFETIPLAGNTQAVPA